MKKIIWSKRSDASLERIRKFYSEKSITAAGKIVAEIIETAERIHFPEQYQIEESLGKNYRRAIVRHFKIIYRIDENGNIRILQIFDTRNDPKKM